ncbi:g547 [Coccomyxa elongata]
MSVDAATEVTPSKSAGLPKPRASLLTGLCIQLVMLALMLAGFIALIVLIVRQDRPETHAQLLCQGLEPSKVERQDAYDKYSKLALAVIVALFSLGDKIHSIVTLRSHKQQLQAVTSAQQSAQQQQQQQPLTSGEDWGIDSDAGDREVDVDITIHKHYSAPVRR